jgi:hypothetical protein
MMKGEWRIAGDFLEGSAPALPKILGTSEDVPSSITENFSAHQEMRHPVLLAFV